MGIHTIPNDHKTYHIICNILYPVIKNKTNKIGPNHNTDYNIYNNMK